jgi:hypothetical protein
MKTPSEEKFDELIKEVFAATLKPLGFKKKANNFYINNGEIGKIINIQKSSANSRDHIRFTINIGIFSPEYWKVRFNYQDKPDVPAFPTEPECIIRNRIGDLLKQNDTWYDVTDAIDLGSLKNIQHRNVKEIILPYFAAINTNDDLLREMSKGARTESPIARLTLLGELKRTDAAKEELEKLLSTEIRPNHKRIITETARTYGLI